MQPSTTTTERLRENNHIALNRPLANGEPKFISAVDTNTCIFCYLFFVIFIIAVFYIITIY